MHLWKQRDGKYIPVVSMTPAHLINSVNMARRLGKTRALAILTAELRRRQAILEEEEDFMSEVYDECCIGGVDRYGSLQQ